VGKTSYRDGSTLSAYSRSNLWADVRHDFNPVMVSAVQVRSADPRRPTYPGMSLRNPPSWTGDTTERFVAHQAIVPSRFRIGL
jgi:hypothetical protein